MPESPCTNPTCKEMTQHTDDDPQPLCELCTEKLMWQKILFDIVEGRLVLERDERGRLIIPGHVYPD